MDLLEAIQKRHAVRKYTTQPIPADIITALRDEIAACNQAGGLHIQLITDEPAAFGSVLTHYGFFSNVRNYVALIGKKDAALDEKIGYYGEKIALRAQQLGLNTCWVALTFSKGKSKNNCVIGPDETLVCVLTVGYGATQGTPHKNKPLEKLCAVNGPMPDWFRKGMEAAQLAPTAVNQQKFLFTLSDGNTVTAKATGGFYDKVDLGIVKYHFEIGAGKENFNWG